MGVKSFVEGGIASVVAGCSTHPLDLIKVRLQLHGEASAVPLLRPALAFHNSPPAFLETTHSVPKVGPISLGINLVKTEGAAALFSGVSATLLRQTLYSTTRMGLYEVLKNKWTDPESGKLSLTRKIAAGLVGGGIGAAVGNPADVAMVRMQADGRLFIKGLFLRFAGKDLSLLCSLLRWSKSRSCFVIFDYHLKVMMMTTTKNKNTSSIDLIGIFCIGLFIFGIFKHCC
ncbi:hypothetical protein DY000_02038200 [Brassica cretica]|uniref:Uncharacterized protein n=1 Tax=Brassica cretica TaxID=69181 RepID=A0ABQ7BNC6_BRACR|nr:hypothetical protein DY000_02038200 [Brassica cretica]